MEKVFHMVRPDPLDIKPITWTGLLGAYTADCDVEQTPQGDWAIVRKSGDQRRNLWSFETEASCRTAFGIWKNGG